MPNRSLLRDATAEAELVRRKEATALELVEDAIGRIEKLDRELNAVIHPLFEKARDQARGFVPAGPFQGVPFLLKDILGYTAGDPYHMGLRRLRDLGVVGPQDTYLARKLRDAGLIFVGRTNVPELGTLPTTESEAYGACRNPWNTAHTPGGSSGGSAAAVASGMVPAAHGNDGGGSIRIPASMCGLVGLKPSRGRTSFGPDLGDPVAGLVCEGVLTRTVRDTAALLDAIAGVMPGDPYSAPSPARPYREEVGAAPGKLRIGLMTSAPRGEFAVHPECVTAAKEAARALESLGHTVEESHPLALDDPTLGHHFTVMYATHGARTQDMIGLLTGSPLTDADVDPVNWTLATLGRQCSAVDYLAATDWIRSFTRHVAAWHVDGFDLLLTPTLSEPPPRLGELVPTPETAADVGLHASRLACFTLPFNMTGQPAISLPLHWSAGGLPIGVQLVALYGREDLLIRVAAELEQAVPWADRVPPVHA